MYTHRWTYRPGHPAYIAAWPAIVNDTRRIIVRVRAAGIVIAGPNGLRRPVIDAADGITFNGDATSDLDGQPFHLLPAQPILDQESPGATAFCATGRKPYDLAVAAVLLRCHLLAGEAFIIASDGDWTREWAYGATPVGRRVGARTVIADLFAATPTTSPLTDTVAVLRGHPIATPTTEPATDPRAASPTSTAPLHLGQQVHVHAYGNWRPGTITKIGPRRVTVRFTRNAHGDIDERAFPVAYVHPAAGIRLTPVHQLGRGDVVLHADGDAAVAHVRSGPRRYRTVTYTDGTQVDLAAQTIVRVRTQRPTDTAGSQPDPGR